MTTKPEPFIVPIVHCGTHEDQAPAAVCVHLVDAADNSAGIRALGFRETQTHNGIPVALCGACWDLFCREHLAVSPLLGLIRLICLRCFLRLRELAGR